MSELDSEDRRDVLPLLSSRTVSACDVEVDADEDEPAVGRRVSWLWKRLRRTLLVELLVEPTPAPREPVVIEDLEIPAPVRPVLAVAVAVWLWAWPGRGWEGAG